MPAASRSAASSPSQNFGAGDILEIAPPDGLSLLIPFTNATVPDIDIAGGRLTIVPPASKSKSTEEEP